jgi:hypothetical protein
LPKLKDKKADNDEEYGVILKDKKHKKRIYPQKGKKPLKDDESYRIV